METFATRLLILLSAALAFACASASHPSHAKFYSTQPLLGAAHDDQGFSPSPVPAPPLLALTPAFGFAIVLMLLARAAAPAHRPLPRALHRYVASGLSPPAFS